MKSVVWFAAVLAVAVVSFAIIRNPPPVAQNGAAANREPSRPAPEKAGSDLQSSQSRSAASTDAAVRIPSANAVPSPRARFDQSRDLLSLIAALETDGTSAAESKLVQGLAYRECEAVSGVLQKGGDVSDFFGANDSTYPETQEKTRFAVARAIERCSTLVGQRQLHIGQHKELLRQAAELGSIEAAAATLNETLRDQGAGAARAVVEQVIGSGNTAALLEVSDFASANSASMFPRESVLHELKDHPHALIMAVCRLGHDCSGTGSLMYRICLAKTPCHFSNVEELIRNVWLVPVELKRENAYVDRLIQEVGRD